ncbi:MAG: transposase, partial [Mesorhizobium sp.]
MCRKALQELNRCAVSPASAGLDYRHWRQSAPRQEETGLRDVIQRLPLANRHYGYRRIGALLGREGWQVNHKRVLRVMGEDNLLCLR